MTDSCLRSSLPSHPLHNDVTQTGPSYFESEEMKSISADARARLNEMHTTFEETRVKKLAELASNLKEFCAPPSMFASSSRKEETLEILRPRPFVDVKREWESKRANREQCQGGNWIELEPSYIDIRGCLTLVFIPKVTKTNCNSSMDSLSDNGSEDFTDNCSHLSSVLNDGDDVTNSPTSASTARGDNIRREDSMDEINCSQLPSLFPYYLGRYYDNTGLLMWRESSVYYF